MRPRLSEPEVKFLLDLLEPKRKEAEERYANSFSRLEPERNQLRTFLEKVSRLSTVYDTDGIEQKRQRLDTVQKEIDSNWSQMVLYRGLITRFEDLLGHKKRGRLKSESDMSRDFITKQVEPEGMKEQTPSINVEPEARKELAPKETTDLVDLATARAWEALTRTLNNPNEHPTEHQPELNSVIVLPTPDSSEDLFDSYMERIGTGTLPPCARTTSSENSEQKPVDRATPEPVKEEPKPEPKNDDGTIPFVLKPERKKRKPENDDGKTHFVLTFGS